MPIINALELLLIAFVGTVVATGDVKMFLGWSSADLPDDTCSKRTIAHMDLKKKDAFLNLLSGSPVQCGLRAAAKLLGCHDAWGKASTSPASKDPTFEKCIHEDATSVLTNLKSCCVLAKEGTAEETKRKAAMAAPFDFACKTDPSQMDTYEGFSAKFLEQAKCSVGRMAQLNDFYKAWRVDFQIKCGGRGSQSSHETPQQCEARKKNLIACAATIADQVKRCCDRKETNEAINCAHAVAVATDHMDLSR